VANKLITAATSLTPALGDELPINRSGSDGKITVGTGSSLKVLATADVTFYVRTDGSDSNNGLANTAGGAFLTLQAAFNNLQNYDFQNKYNPTIQVAAGTYTCTTSQNGIIGNVCNAVPNSGQVILVGDTATPDNVILQANTDVLMFAGNGSWSVRGFQLKSTSAGSCIVAMDGASVDAGHIHFTGAPDNPISVVRKSALRWNFGEAFTVDVPSTRGLVRVSGGSLAIIEDITIDINSAMSIGATGFHGFIYILDHSILYLNGTTINGAVNVTGRKYNFHNGAVFFAGTTWTPDTLPGTTAGVMTGDSSVGITANTNINRVILGDALTGVSPSITAEGVDTNVPLTISCAPSTDNATALDVVLRSSFDGPTVVFRSSNPTNTGPILLLDHNPVTQNSSGVVGGLLFQGRDSAGNNQNYSFIDARVRSATNGAEYGEVAIAAPVNGNPNQYRLRIGDGVVVGNSTALPGVGNLRADGFVQTYATSVAALPTSSAGNVGARAFVTDATTNAFMAAVVGGSTYGVPVVSNGTGWVIG
jgi:hypothetical protein